MSKRVKAKGKRVKAKGHVVCNHCGVRADMPLGLSLTDMSIWADTWLAQGCTWHLNLETADG